MNPKLFDTFKETADRIAFLDRGYGIGKPDVQSAIEKVYSEINRTNPTLEIVSVKDFGAKGDGVTDDTRAIQNAATMANNQKSILFIPPGEYLVTETIKIACDVISQGKLIRPTNVSDWYIIDIVRDNPNGILIPIENISQDDLFEGSSKINGLKGYRGGTVVITSNEELIKRNNPPGNEPYQKMEASIIIDDEGTIYPPLSTDYNLSLIESIIVYPFDDPISIDNLLIDIVGEDFDDRSVIRITRSNVYLNGLSVNNKSQSTPRDGISVHDSANIVFNNLFLNGIYREGLGYGVLLSNTAFVRFNNCFISDCRTAIDGRHNKAIFINGGAYASKIGDHWVNGFHVDGAVVESIGVAGSDLTVTNTQFNPTSQIAVSIRNDTPELFGNVYLENLIINSVFTNPVILAYSSGSNEYDYGERPVRTPKYIKLSNITVRTKDNAVRVTGIDLNGVTRTYKRTSPQKIVIEKVLCDVPFLAILYDKNPDIYIDNYPTDIIIRDINFRTPNDNYVAVFRNRGAEDPSFGYNLIIDNCTGVKPLIDAGVFKTARITNSQLYERTDRANAKSPIPDSNFIIEGCLIEDVYFFGENKYHFRNNIFKGEIRASGAGGLNINTITLSSFGNIAEIGTTGYPPLDGFVNPERYIVE